MEKGDYEKLTKFMLSLPNDKSLYQNEDVVRAQCVALFHINDFKTLYHQLESQHFATEHHQFLQVLVHHNSLHYTYSGTLVQSTLSRSPKNEEQTSRRC